MQQQEGTVDCGLFAIANAIEVCQGNNPEHVKFDQEKMRSHLLECLNNEQLTVFPKISGKEVLPQPTESVTRLKYFVTAECPKNMMN